MTGASMKLWICAEPQTGASAAAPAATGSYAIPSAIDAFHLSADGVHAVLGHWILAPYGRLWNPRGPWMQCGWGCGAWHVSRAMLSRYSHVRMEAKRRALDEIAARPRGA